MRVIFLILSSIFLLSACEDVDNNTLNYSDLSAPALVDDESMPGGNTTVLSRPFVSFQRPAANLNDDLQATFHAGKALANQPWVKAPTITTARDGLGPIYNARTCLTCHVKGGKGFIPENNKTPLTSTLVRLSIMGDTLDTLKTSGLIPHPVYGDQIQSQSISCLLHAAQR